MEPEKLVSYKRSRFSTRLPEGRLYTPSHFWLREMEPGLWRVGFTKFAIRMLGDFVEHGFSTKPGEAVVVGQTIGWVEGFKAVTDVYCVVNGAFDGPNPALANDITLADSDPYGAGWLYTARGTAEPNGVDVLAYTEILDLTIDKMQQGMPDQSGTPGKKDEDANCP